LASAALRRTESIARERGALALVGFARRDDLAVAGLEAEAELVGLVLVELELPGMSAS
jgi:hypothetical protein